MASSHRIRVLGRELLVRSEAPAETVREIEAFVNGKVAEVSTSVRGGDPQVVAVLTLMNIAEEYLALAREKAARGGEDETVQRLIRRLDSVVE